jgi:hypothetical protein
LKVIGHLKISGVVEDNDSRMTWPTNMDKFTLAMHKASPDQQLALRRLLKEVRKAMDYQMQLNYAVWRWHVDQDKDYVETEWPCDLDSLRAVMADGKHDHLNSLYILAIEGVPPKVALDKMVAGLTGEALTGEALTGEALAGEALTGEAVGGAVGGAVTGEAVTGEAVTGEAVTGGPVTGEPVDTGYVTAEEVEALAQRSPNYRRYSMFYLQRILGLKPKD